MVRTAVLLALALGVACGGSTDDEGGLGGTGGTGGQSGSSGTAGASGTAAGATSSQGGSSTSGGSGGTAVNGGTTGGAGTTGAGAVSATDAGGRDLCDLPPEPGPCRGSMQRFYFDAVAGQCLEFVYGGCEGNANNFETHQACAAACAHRAHDCRVCTLESCHARDCTGCPVSPDSHGESCSVPSLECSFGQGCGQTVCTCSAFTPGVWACATLLIPC
jgi:hypothetical protein